LSRWTASRLVPSRRMPKVALRVAKTPHARSVGRPDPRLCRNAAQISHRSVSQPCGFTSSVPVSALRGELL
jgi:hypothetical protein